MPDFHIALGIAPPAFALGLIGFAVLGPRGAKPSSAQVDESAVIPPYRDVASMPASAAMLSPRLLERRARAAQTLAEPAEAVPTVQDILDRPVVADAPSAEAEAVMTTEVAPESRESTVASALDEAAIAETVDASSEHESEPRRSGFSRITNALLGISRLFRRARVIADAPVDQVDDLGPADAAVLRDAVATLAPIVSPNEKVGVSAVSVADANAAQYRDEAGDDGLLFPLVLDELAPSRPVAVAEPSAEPIVPPADEAVELEVAVTPVLKTTLAGTNAVDLAQPVVPEPELVEEEAVSAALPVRMQTWFERLAPERAGASADDRATVARSLGDVRLDWAADLIESAYPTEEAPVQTALVYAMGAGRHFSRSGFFYLAMENDELAVRIAALDVVSAFHAARVEWTEDVLRATLFDGQVGHIAAGVLTGDDGDMRAIVEPVIGGAATDVLLKKATLFL